MNSLCEQLCSETGTVVDEESINLARKLMDHLHADLHGCDRKTYVWVFTHVTALAIQIRTALQGEKPLPGERWAEFISASLKVH